MQDVFQKRREPVLALPSKAERVDRLCELNAIEQVAHLCCTTIVQDAWARQLQLSVHGWIYGLSDEHLRVGVSRPGDLEPTYHRAIAGLGARVLPNA